MTQGKFPHPIPPEIAERERRLFKPFIFVRTEGSAHSSAAAIHERKVKILWMPEGFQSLPESDKLKAVQARVRKHFVTSEGKIAGFGDIQEYQFAGTFDTSVVLDAAGNVIDQNGGRFLLPEVLLAVWTATH
jgi:hypothetical protein